MVRWMQRIAAGEPPLIFGDGLQTMDLVHVTDVARANILAAEAPVSDAVFNVGTGTETSLLDLAGFFATAMGRPDLRPAHMEERAVNPVPRRLASIAAIREMLGFQPVVPLPEGVASLVAWWRGETAPVRLEEMAS
jgi:UDP-glucose 4-epimerase